MPFLLFGHRDSHGDDRPVVVYADEETIVKVNPAILKARGHKHTKADMSVVTCDIPLEFTLAEATALASRMVQRHEIEECDVVLDRNGKFDEIKIREGTLTVEPPSKIVAHRED